MEIAETKKVEAALAVVRDSERLLIDLRFSKSSHSLGRDLGNSGLEPYLKATKRTLRVQLVKNRYPRSVALDLPVNPGR